MSKNIYAFLLLIILTSCENRKTEFVQSKVYPDMYLMKNPPHSDSLLKTAITSFIKTKRSANENLSIDIYEYNSETSYYLDNKEDDGGSTSMHFLSNCEQDRIAYFTFSKCKNDSTKLFGKLDCSGKAWNKSIVDTIICQCK